MSIKKVTAKEFLALFDKEVHNLVAQSLKNLESTGIVYFENLQMDSPRCGDHSVFYVGPNNTYKTVAECEGKWLNDLPSQRQYPQVWCDAKEIIAEVEK